MVKLQEAMGYPQNFTKFSGACRTASLSDGTYSTHSQKTLNWCIEKCLGLETLCAAIEYYPNRADCEIHKAVITRTIPSNYIDCYIRGKIFSGNSNCFCL